MPALRLRSVAALTSGVVPNSSTLLDFDSLLLATSYPLAPVTVGLYQSPNQRRGDGERLSSSFLRVTAAENAIMRPKLRTSLATGMGGAAGYLPLPAAAWAEEASATATAP